MRTAMKNKLPSTRPSARASEEVAELSGKGPYFARRLRHLSAYLLRTGMLPETRQGKGAAHESLLNRSEVRAGLRLFVTGLIPIDEGGFEGRVSVLLLQSF
jgi:hypothetical protein